MAYNTLAEIPADIEVKLANNNERKITEAVLRQLVGDVVEFFSRKTPMYDRIQHTGDADFAVTADSFIVICDDISAIRTVGIPPVSYNGHRMILFVKMPAAIGVYWQTSIPFFNGTTGQQQLMVGRNELLFDLVDNEWILLG